MKQVLHHHVKLHILDTSGNYWLSIADYDAMLANAENQAYFKKKLQLTFYFVSYLKLEQWEFVKHMSVHEKDKYCIV